MNALNLGSLNVDYVYQVDHIVHPGETISGRTLQTFPGGKGANQSNAIAKAGGRVWHAGKVGEEGRWMLDVLGEAGVHTDLVRVYDGPSGHAVIQVDTRGENSIVLYGGGNHAITTEEIDDFLSGFSAGDYLVLQNEITNVPYAIDAAAKKGMRICLNPAPFDEAIRTWPLELVEILLLNHTEAVGLIGADGGADGTAEELLSRLTATYPNTEVVLTAGAAGALFGRGDDRAARPAHPVDVVDTTAAGDTFLGYYLVSRAAGTAPGEALERAARAAAVAVSRPGAMYSIPWARELR